MYCENKKKTRITTSTQSDYHWEPFATWNLLLKQGFAWISKFSRSFTRTTWSVLFRYLHSSIDDNIFLVLSGGKNHAKRSLLASNQTPPICLKNATERINDYIYYIYRSIHLDADNDRYRQTQRHRHKYMDADTSLADTRCKCKPLPINHNSSVSK